MAYGPLAQCAFMSGPPQWRKRGDPEEKTWKLWDELSPYSAPAKAEPAPIGSFMMYAFDVDEAKTDAKYRSRQMPLDEVRAAVFGSAQDIDGQVFDGHKSVQKQHSCLYHVKGKWFLKAINGITSIESISLHPYIKDSEGRAPKRYASSSGKKCISFAAMDPKKQLTREMCIIKLSDSNRRFWISGPLPLGEGEAEELPSGGTREGDRGGERGEHRAGDRKGKKDKRGDREDDRHRDRSRSRSPRSRSRKRRR